MMTEATDYQQQYEGRLRAIQLARQIYPGETRLDDHLRDRVEAGIRDVLLGAVALTDPAREITSDEIEDRAIAHGVREAVTLEARFYAGEPLEGVTMAGAI